MPSFEREKKRKRPIEPPTPAVGSEDLDFISRLPDCALSSILSLLPIKDSARTSILSSRWRHLWKAAPLRLDDSSLLPYKPLCRGLKLPLRTWQWTRDAVSRIFGSHCGAVHSLRLSRFCYPPVKRYVESAVKRGVRELTLDFFLNSVPYQLLPSLLHCESLRQLSLTRCEFPEPVLPSIFPNLQELRLNSIKLSNDLLQVLQSNCGSLETLHLSSCWGLPVVTISSLRLRKLVCKFFAWTKKLIIEDAPNLESFMLGDRMTTHCEVMILHAPKLELLGFVCMKFGVLQLGQTFFKQQLQNSGCGTVTIDVKATPCGMRTLSTVKTLAIKMDFSNLDRILPSFLRCFPCLENLDILNNDIGYTLHKGFWDEQGSFSFLDHLKTVTIKGFCGHQSEVEFLSYLVVHGKVLQKITLLSPKYVCGKFVETKRREVCMDKRGSPDLELFFFDDTHPSDHFSLWNELIHIVIRF